MYTVALQNLNSKCSENCFKVAVPILILEIKICNSKQYWESWPSVNFTL